jgi:hypothetical protein
MLNRAMGSGKELEREIGPSHRQAVAHNLHKGCCHPISIDLNWIATIEHDQLWATLQPEMLAVGTS